MSADFIDSNVFIYLFDETDARKRLSADQLLIDALNTQQGCISFQVVQETLHVITQKLPSPVKLEDAQQFLKTVLTPLWKVHPSPSLYRRALEIQARYRYAFYDSLIVAAALEAGCTRLYSEDMQPNQRIETLTIINPFSELT
ncbi:MAG: PIN domain-containing protein [bacterium]|nr:PIN domain-containing protein [bacterium]